MRLLTRFFPPLNFKLVKMKSSLIKLIFLLSSALIVANEEAKYAYVHKYEHKKIHFSYHRIPQFIKTAIGFQKTHTIAEKVKQITEATEFLKKLAEESVQKNDERILCMKPDIHMINSKVNIELLEKLIEFTGFSDSKLVEYLEHGIPNSGVIDESGNLDRLVIENNDTELQMLNKKKQKEVKQILSGKSFSLRKKPPSFMSETNLHRIWNEWAHEMENSDKHTEIEEKQITIEPVYGFGVEQGSFRTELINGKKTNVLDKLRPCFDWRPLKESVLQVEKLRLLGKRETEEILTALMSKYRTRTPQIQIKNDLKQDVIREKQWRDEQKRTFTELEEDDNIELLSFTPHLTGTAFEKYYNQFAVKDKTCNTLALWDPHKNKYRYFESRVLTFGSLWSINFAIRFSECLQFLMVKLTKAVLTIYIDDTTLFSQQELVALELYFILFILSLIGVKVAHKKTVSTYPSDIENIFIKLKGCISRSITSLGIVYTRFDNHFSIIPTHCKIEKLLDSLRLLKLEIADQCILFKHLQHVAGLAQYVFSSIHSNLQTFWIRGLYSW